MKTKVSLLGDSIRLIGYGKVVPELLGEEFEVFQPSTNCRFAKHTLQMLHDHRDDLAGSEVIHWNNGLWDVIDRFGDGFFTDESEYVATMTRIARLLLRITPKVIFATTTPRRNNQTRNEGIRRYNELVVPRLVELGVEINDLHALILPKVDEYISDDMTHLSELGIKVVGERVAECIRAAAAR